MNYEQTLEQAKQRLQELSAKRTEIEREMQALARIIEGAQIIAQPAEVLILPDSPDEQNTEELGVTKSIRLILGRARTPLMPTEIRDALESMGIEGSSSKVLLIHVHNVLRRLFENGEIEQIPQDGKMAYRALTAADLFVRTLTSHPLGALLASGATKRGNTLLTGAMDKSDKEKK